MNVNVASDGATFPISITGNARVVTENSVWLLTDTQYLRLPKSESPRWNGGAGSRRTVDGKWMTYLRAAWKREADGLWRLRIWPAARPGLHGSGIITGIVISLRGIETPPKWNEDHA